MTFKSGSPVRLLFGIIALSAFMLALAAPASGSSENINISRPAASDSLTASLVTCYPGPEIYELCGHEAIRIKGRDDTGAYIDSVWNYGIFDFDTPNFVYRFVKGETDYIVAGYPFEWFLPQYVQRGSRVVEQTVSLSQEEVRRLRKMLQTNALPQNRVYRYNYVRDNCATRVVNMLDSAADGDIVITEPEEFSTFRNAMRHYHANYPWYQFGIDLALGSGIDVPISPREEMFAPLLLEKNMASAHFSDGRPVVSHTDLLFEGSGDPVLPPTPFFLSPLAVSLIVLIISVGAVVYGWMRNTLARWWYALYFGIAGIAGCIIWFLVFVSSHFATSPNILYLWLSPLQLVIPACLWWQKGRPAVVAMIWINILIVALLMIIWPWQAQSANPAFFPLMAADLVLCAGYIRYFSLPVSTLHNIRHGARVRKKKASEKRNSSKRK